MKLVVCIPAYNEEGSIGEVIRRIPGKIPGISRMEILVVDDGSQDATAETARKAGADRIISNSKRRGLARTFQKGVETSLSLGADITVTIDADLQYDPMEIPKLIQPIMEGRADMVIGERQIERVAHLPGHKRMGNIIGSAFLRFLLRNEIQDASSGFRAFSKKCLENLRISSRHTYTHESIIQAAFGKMRIAEVPITFNERTFGRSRLIKNTFVHIVLSGLEIMRAYLIFRFFKKRAKCMPLGQK